MHDTGELQHFLIDGSSYFLVESLLFVVIAVMLVHLDAKLALLVFLPVPYLAVLRAAAVVHSHLELDDTRIFGRRTHLRRA
jgi:hypothetical protein